MKLIALALAIVGCDDKPAERPARSIASMSRESPAPPPVVAPPDAAPVFTDRDAEEMAKNMDKLVVEASLAKLAADYAENTVAADDKYRDRTLAGRARPSRSGARAHAAPFLELQVGHERTFVRARFIDEAGLAALKPGQQISARCFCSGFVKYSLVLTGCVLDK